MGKDYAIEMISVSPSSRIQRFAAVKRRMPRTHDVTAARLLANPNTVVDLVCGTASRLARAKSHGRSTVQQAGEPPTRYLNRR